MLDLDYIRDHPEEVQEACQLKGEDVDVQEILTLDEDRRNLQHELDEKRHRRNEGSEKVGELKQKGEDASDLIEELSDLSDEIDRGEERLKEIEQEMEKQLQWIPNIPADDVPVGDVEEDNEELRRWGEKPDFDFEPKPHWDLGPELGIINFDAASKLSGSGFYTLTGDGALLERGLMNWMLDRHTNQNGYREMQVPYLNRPDVLFGTGQLPKLEGDMYRTRDHDQYLIPTSEVPLVNFHREEILSEEDLPLYYTCGSACFRREAGAAGTDTRGMTRVHQFQKVELVKIIEPGNDADELEGMLEDAEEILKELGLHYRVLLLCTGDMSFASRKTFDLEVWAPGSERWLEVSSISTCTDFQARRCNMRYRDEEGDLHHPHTLNGSGLALPRTIIALLETYQTEEGHVEIPEPIQDHLKGMDRITPS